MKTGSRVDEATTPSYPAIVATTVSTAMRVASACLVDLGLIRFSLKAAATCTYRAAQVRISSMLGTAPTDA
jgi:hypothetical protein